MQERQSSARCLSLLCLRQIPHSFPFSSPFRAVLYCSSSTSPETCFLPFPNRTITSPRKRLPLRHTRQARVAAVAYSIRSLRNLSATITCVFYVCSPVACLQLHEVPLSILRTRRSYSECLAFEPSLLPEVTPFRYHTEEKQPRCSVPNCKPRHRVNRAACANNCLAHTIRLQTAACFIAHGGARSSLTAPLVLP